MSRVVGGSGCTAATRAVPVRALLRWVGAGWTDQNKWRVNELWLHAVPDDLRH